MLVRFSRRVWHSSFAWGGGVMLLRVAGFLLVMAYALRLLPSEDVGLWYVMMNIAGLATAVDFGFSVVIARHASYYQGGLHHVPETGLQEGGASGSFNGPGLAGLVLMARRLYRWLALFMGVGMAVTWVGWVSYMTIVQHRQVSWVSSVEFGVLALGSVYGMAGLFWPQLLFGLNQVKRFQQITLVGLVVNYGVAAVGLRMGLGILALVAGQLAFIVLPRVLAQRRVFQALSPDDFANARVIRWQQLWPMTWRSGILGVSSYLVIQNLTLVCSWIMDLKTTASFGLTLQIAIMLHGFAALWISVKQPEITMQRASGNISGVIHLVRRRIILSVATYVAGAMFLMLTAPVLLTWVGAKTGVLKPEWMFCLLLFIGVELFLGLHSAILQTGNETPHLPAAIVGAVLALLLFWPMGMRWGVPGILGASVLGQLAMNYWWTPWQCWIRLQKRSVQEAI